MLGDVLKRDLWKLKRTSKKKNDNNAFWIVLRDIAKQEIIEYCDYIDSDTIIPLYYQILNENREFIPSFYKGVLKSNKQERFRVIIRNVFSSNAFHKDGLANQEGIIAYKEVNREKKGERIVYKKSDVSK